MSTPTTRCRTREDAVLAVFAKLDEIDDLSRPVRVAVGEYAEGVKPPGWYWTVVISTEYTDRQADWVRPQNQAREVAEAKRLLIAGGNQWPKPYVPDDEAST